MRKVRGNIGKVRVACGACAMGSPRGASGMDELFALMRQCCRNGANFVTMRQIIRSLAHQVEGRELTTHGNQTGAITPGNGRFLAGGAAS
jgi:acetyl-CoA acetyltransferase